MRLRGAGLFAQTQYRQRENMETSASVGNIKMDIRDSASTQTSRSNLYDLKRVKSESCDSIHQNRIYSVRKMANRDGIYIGECNMAAR